MSIHVCSRSVNSLFYVGCDHKSELTLGLLTLLDMHLALLIYLFIY